MDAARTDAAAADGPYSAVLVLSRAVLKGCRWSRDSHRPIA